MRRLPALPLFGQTLGLVIVSLLIAQTLSVLVLLSLPPPPPLVYTVAEVVQAVRSQGDTAPGSTPVLMSRVVDRPPDSNTVGRRRLHFRDALGEALGVDPANIVVAQAGPRIIALGGRRSDAQQRELLRDAPEPLLMGAFEIGVRRADHRWLMVSPRTTWGIDPWQQRLLLVLALSVLAVSPLAWLFSRRIAAPIAALAAGAERLGRDPRAPHLEIVGSAEVAAAAKAFNEMQEHLRRYVDERVGMLGAIAHDLRTPLTRLRFRVEGTPDPLREKIIGDIDQMEAMVASVLGFVRDAAQTRDHCKLEVSSLVETVMDEAALTGADAAIDRVERLVVDGDPLALKRLFVNLVDNALKFGTRARARVLAEGGMAIIEIDDDGPGMPETEIERVFEPFHRIEGSRNRETGGIGLGLSVARAVARGHGGDVVLRNRAAGGLRARVCLPIARCDEAPSWSDAAAARPLLPISVP
jgi:signal transduction histidine kinase